MKGSESMTLEKYFQYDDFLVCSQCQICSDVRDFMFTDECPNCQAPISEVIEWRDMGINDTAIVGGVYEL